MRFEERLEWLKKIFGPSDAPTYSNVMVVEHVLCKGKSHVMEMLDDLQKKGAEGLMLRQPKSYVLSSLVHFSITYIKFTKVIRKSSILYVAQSENFL
jgi:hypothetical protein